MENKIKDIFQKKLSDFEASVDASTWTAIQSGISGGAASTSVGILGSLGAKIGAALLGAAILIGAVYLVNTPNEEIIKKTETQEIIVDKFQPTEVINESRVEEVSVTIEDKKKVEKAVSISKENEEVKSISTETQTENNNNSSPEEITTEIATNSTPTAVVSSKNEQEKVDAKQIVDVVPPTPISEEEPVNLKADFTVSLIDQDELSYQFSSKVAYADNVLYQWDFGNGDLLNNATNPSWGYEEEGTYKVTLTLIDENGNTKVFNQIVDAYYPATWEIQDIFTPNDDQYNQYFDVAAKVTNMTITSVMIFDTNQKTVFSSVNDNFKWDGQLLDGSIAEQGYYFYRATALGNDGKPYEKTGRVYLITQR